MRIAQQDSTSTAYFLPDALGSVRQLVDETGAVTLAQAFQPYGETLSSTGTGSTAYGFTGEWTDSSGLVHLRARYYAPGIARFMTRDPWDGDAMKPMSYNPWLYVYANPLRYTDPSGMIACELLPPIDQAGCQTGGSSGSGGANTPPYGPPPPCNPALIAAGIPCWHLPCSGGPGPGAPPPGIGGGSGSGGGSPSGNPGIPSYPDWLPEEAQNEYDTYIALRDTSGWWNSGGGMFTVHDFLELFLRLEFKLPAKYAKEELQLETAVRNFFEYCIGCNYLTAEGIFRHIDNKNMLDISKRKTYDLSRPEGSINTWINVDQNSLSTADFSTAFISPNPTWMTGRGDGNEPFDWGNACLVTKEGFNNVKIGSAENQVIWRTTRFDGTDDPMFFFIVSYDQKLYWNPSTKNNTCN